MKKIILLTLISFSVFSQEKIDISNLYKEWELVSLEKNGKTRNADEFDKNETIIFYKNQKFKMKDSEQTINGIWKFNTLTNNLELSLVEFGKKIIVNLVSLSYDELKYISPEIDEKIIFNFKAKLKQ